MSFGHGEVAHRVFALNGIPQLWLFRSCSAAFESRRREVCQYKDVRSKYSADTRILAQCELNWTQLLLMRQASLTADFRGHLRTNTFPFSLVIDSGIRFGGV